METEIEREREGGRKKKKMEKGRNFRPYTKFIICWTKGYNCKKLGPWKEAKYKFEDRRLSVQITGRERQGGVRNCSWLIGRACLVFRLRSSLSSCHNMALSSLLSVDLMLLARELFAACPHAEKHGIHRVRKVDFEEMGRNPSDL